MIDSSRAIVTKSVLVANIIKFYGFHVIRKCTKEIVSMELELGNEAIR